MQLPVKSYISECILRKKIALELANIWGSAQIFQIKRKYLSPRHDYLPTCANLPERWPWMRTMLEIGKYFSLLACLGAEHSFFHLVDGKLWPLWGKEEPSLFTGDPKAIWTKAFRGNRIYLKALPVHLVTDESGEQIHFISLYSSSSIGISN